MTIVIPGSAAPSNLHFSDHTKLAMVESDLYNICERIKEVDPALFIVVAEDPAVGERSFTIMEKCADGTDRFVYRTDELDARIIEKCQYLKAVPFEQRFARAEAEADAAEAAAKERAAEEFYENMGGPMYSQIHKDGFVDSRRESYPKIKGRL